MIGVYVNLFTTQHNPLNVTAKKSFLAQLQLPASQFAKNTLIYRYILVWGSMIQDDSSKTLSLKTTLQCCNKFCKKNFTNHTPELFNKVFVKGALRL